jgi:hypothetical protein
MMNNLQATKNGTRNHVMTVNDAVREDPADLWPGDTVTWEDGTPFAYIGASGDIILERLVSFGDIAETAGMTVAREIAEETAQRHVA